MMARQHLHGICRTFAVLSEASILSVRSEGRQQRNARWELPVTGGQVRP